MSRAPESALSWTGILRLGLVQGSMGAIVVLATSTLNRVMVVELALPAMVPGALVAIHHLVQLTRPRLGYGSDVGGRRSPWVLGGMALLALGGVLAAAATVWMASSPLWGTALGVLAFVLIGLGAGASGTSLLVLVAKRAGETRRAAAATALWVMMIMGFVLTATAVGHLLDPFSLGRLVPVAALVGAAALATTALALWGIEGPATAPADPRPAALQAPGFREALAQVWSEREARRFAAFVLVSMLAYSAQDLILEPFAGIAFGLTPGETTRLSGVQNAGVLAGMVLFGVLGSLGRGRLGSLWTQLGCVASALALLNLAWGAAWGVGFPLRGSVFALGLANGIYAVSAIGSMMGLAGHGRENREGVRMGLWGAAQAISFGLGGFVGTAAADLARAILGDPVPAYASVFVAEAGLFLVSAALARGLGAGSGAAEARSDIDLGDGATIGLAEAAAEGG